MSPHVVIIFVAVMVEQQIVNNPTNVLHDPILSSILLLNMETMQLVNIILVAPEHHRYHLPLSFIRPVSKPYAQMMPA